MTLSDGDSGSFMLAKSLISSSYRTLEPASVFVTLACSRLSSSCFGAVLPCRFGQNFDCNFSMTLFFMTPLVGEPEFTTRAPSVAATASPLVLNSSYIFCYAFVSWPCGALAYISCLFAVVLFVPCII